MSQTSTSRTPAVLRAGKHACYLLVSLVRWLIQDARWENLALVTLALAVALLLFYNLELNPRTWHDEGAALTLAKTLAQDGVYAVRNSDGYQSFGPVQSVGPTVILPIALSYKLFGSSLIQGRVIAASYALFTVTVFYLAGRAMYGRRAALFAVIFLIAFPGTGFFLFGRQVLGDLPALGFFLAGWLAWSYGFRYNKKWLFVVAGFLIGAAMVTKMQYIIMGLATIIFLALLDGFRFRRGAFRSLLFAGVIAIICVVAWQAWQYTYFGADIFLDNIAKSSQLSSSTNGFRPQLTIDALQHLFGSGSGYFYFFWGILALIYGGVLAVRGSDHGFPAIFLVLFSCLWLGYFVFWTVPWALYGIAPIAVTALFVGKLYHDLASRLISSRRTVWQELRKSSARPSELTPMGTAYLGSAVALITLTLLTTYELQRTVRADVLDTVGSSSTEFRSAQELRIPHQMAEFLIETIDKEVVVETWERELGALTDHNYHYPDQSLLAKTHAAAYHDGPHDYSLGQKYFTTFRPAYVVVGWWAKFTQIYDFGFLSENSDLIGTIGSDDWGYDVYKLDFK